MTEETTMIEENGKAIRDDDGVHLHAGTPTAPRRHSCNVEEKRIEEKRATFHRRPRRRR
ncbi:uncharacterized protein DS421_12g373530 [Arachis hypogaea]|nr:uncharacterized protein DS421_12g373530 [Arachis hypogaea]